MDISVFDNIFPVDMVNGAAALLDSSGWKYGWHSKEGIEYTHWHHEILGGGPKNTENKESRLVERAQRYGHILSIWQFLKHERLGGQAELLRCYANLHTYGVEGYPHKDSLRPGETTAIVYLNKEWTPEWGGETALYDDKGEIVRSVVPRYGRLLLFPSEMLHAARGVTRLCTESRKTLIYKARIV